MSVGFDHLKVKHTHISTYYQRIQANYYYNMWYQEIYYI